MTATGYRSYEIYQRQRVGESTAHLQPRQLLSEAFLRDPYPALTVLREEYPCYRDWLANAYWITRYDDVTSVFVDEPNYETRTKRWYYGRPELGRDLGAVPVVEACRAARVDQLVSGVAERLVGRLRRDPTPDLAVGAARVAVELLAGVLGVPDDDVAWFAGAYWRAQRGAGWDPTARRDGLAALGELTEYAQRLLAARRADPGPDLVSTLAALDLDDGPVTAADVVVTVLEGDHETLHGGLANLWYLLLTHPDQLAEVRGDPTLVKFAYLEALRHSPPVTAARRFARHEVERFGRLLPAGALLMCSAAAANRDPRAFADPDHFVVGRKDLCQREPRGHYRADGLASGIAFGLGPPSTHPAVPEDRPRSRYAITRDCAVVITRQLLDGLPGLRLLPGAEPELRSLRVGELRTCWWLPVAFER